VRMNLVQVGEFKFCKLCHRNGESDVVYRSHNLKDREGKVVTCPVLRKYTCTLCGVNGDQAHTLRYCPLNKDGTYNRGASLAELKKLRNAAGNYPGHGDTHGDTHGVQPGLGRPTVMLCHPLPQHMRQEPVVDTLETHPIIARIRNLEKEAALLRSRYIYNGASNTGPTQGGVTNVYSGCGALGTWCGPSPWFPPRTPGSSPYIGRSTQDEGRLGFLSKDRGNSGLVGDSWMRQGQAAGARIGEPTGDGLGAMLAELRMGSTEV